MICKEETTQKNGVLLVLAALTLAFFSGCGDEYTTVYAINGFAGVRLLHLSPDAPAVDFYAETTTKLVMDEAFKEGSPYVAIEPGTYSFSVVPAGTDPNPGILLIDSARLSTGSSSTVVALNELNAIEGLLLADNNGSPAKGAIRVRAVHAAPGVGQVDIWDVTDPGNPAALYTDVDFKDVGNYALLPAGNYILGFDIDDDGVPDLSFETGVLPEGSIINLFAVNDGAEVFLIAQFQDGTVVQIDPQ
jgi:hypothetical protein